MCDYSLESYRSRPAVNEEQYTLHRFRSGTLGFIARTDCTTAVCIPAGGRLRLEGLDERLQRSLRVGPAEEVVMIRLRFRDNMHRDGVRFGNGREVLLQRLNTGLSATLVSRDLTAIFDLKGVAKPKPLETEALCAGVEPLYFRCDDVGQPDWTTLHPHSTDVPAGCSAASCSIGRSTAQQGRCLIGHAAAIVNCERAEADGGLLPLPARRDWG